MMHIQWYPGHMTKAMRMMQEEVKQVDCVIYVLDSRAVLSCINEKFNEMIGDKPILYVINKADLVEKSELKKWQGYFFAQKKDCIITNSLGGKEKKIILAKLKVLCKAIIARYAAKGAKKTIRVMVLGVPNTGKSTLINSLCGNKRAMTGNKAGVTRGKQWVVLEDGIELLDTPGTLPPAFQNQQKAKYLAFVGSLKDEILHLDELAGEMINYNRQFNSANFVARYKMESFFDDNLGVFDFIAKARGYFLGANGYDYERVARAIIDDFRKQKFGKLMLDKVGDKEYDDKA
ncbi:MAG: ribosome biogenesis GTPase YlqF [Clostridia bacterium]